MSQVQYTPEQINSLILAVAKAGSDVRKAVAKALLAACWDGNVNGSAKVANALVSALRKSTKKTGVVAFLERFGAMFDSKGTMIVFPDARVEWTAEFAELVRDESIDWESYKSAPKATDYDVVKAVEGVIKSGTKANEKGQCIDHELVEYLQALLAQYTAGKALAKAKASADVVEIVEA